MQTHRWEDVQEAVGAVRARWQGRGKVGIVLGTGLGALAGEIAHFTGVSDPYEAPEAPDVVVRTDRETVEESLDRIWAALESRGLVDAVPEERAS